MDPLVQAIMQAQYGHAPMRSESTQNELARRELQRTPPVTIMQDAIARARAAMGNAAPNNYNSFVDAIRAGAMQKMLETGGPAVDNRGYTSTYGQPLPPFANPALK